MKMSTRIRLKVVEKRLKARGVKDVKFCWAPNVKDFTADQVGMDAVHALEAYLDGKCTPVEKFGDSCVQH